MNSDNEAKDPASEKLQQATRSGLNVATGGAWNRVRRAPVVGNMAKKIEDNVADKVGNSRLGKKLIDPTKHHKPNIGVKNPDEQTKTSDPENNDIGSRNLRNSLANRARNLFNRRKKKQQDSDNESSDNNVDSESEDKTDEEEDSSSKTKENIKRKIIIKLVIASTIGFFVFALIMLVAAALGGGVSMDTPLVTLKGYGTKDFESLTSDDSLMHEKELNYYKKMDEISNEYSDVVDIDFLNAILINLFYEHDFQTDKPELEESSGIDYEMMTENADKLLNMIISFDSTDYEKEGEIYNDLKESDEFKEYYKLALEDKSIDEILNDIFDVADELHKMEPSEEEVISDELEVVVNDPENRDNGNQKTMSIKDYITGSAYANFQNINDSEMVKAYAVVATTNVLADNKNLNISSTNASIFGKTCSVSNGCSYDSNGNLVDGPGERSSLNSQYYNGEYYYKIPLSSSESTKLNSTIDSVFGKALVEKDGTYPNVDIKELGGMSSGDYKTILKSTYGNYNIKNVGEDTYAVDGEYGSKKVLTDVIFYDQNDYSGNSFCGLKNSTIKSSGCGITSMAIVVSTYENSKTYDPIKMNEEAMKKGLCGVKYDGTAQSFFKTEAKAMGYKYLGGTKYDKTITNSVLKHLSEGHLVVIRVGTGHFTSGGHYMVLGGIDPETKKVYVYDPNDRANKTNYRKTGSGWYSFNDIIAKETKNYYIIWKG